MDEDEEFLDAETESDDSKPADDSIGKQFVETGKSAVDFGMKTGKLAFSITKKLVEYATKTSQNEMAKMEKNARKQISEMSDDKLLSIISENTNDRMQVLLEEEANKRHLI